MPPPPNETAATAADMTILPYSLSLDVSGATSPNFDVWWSYTALDGDTAIGFWAFSELAGTYRPRTTVWTGPDAGSISQYLNISALNVPIQVGVTPGETYWFRVRQQNSGVAPNVPIIISALRADDEAVDEGAILVNDDTPGFPAVIVDPATGEPVQFVADFPAGEGGDTLAGGEILVNDFDTETYQLWRKDPTTGRLTYVSTPIAANAGDVVRANRTLDAFYVSMDVSPVQVKRVNPDGSLGATTWTLTGTTSLFALAVDNDEEIAYFATNTAGAAVKRWDLALDSAMADFVAGTANYYVRDILVLSDGSILFSSVQTVFGEITVYRYNAAGVLQDTFGPYDSNIPSGTQPRIAYANDGDTAFWVWTHGESADAGLATFRKIQISDGAVLETVTTTEYEGGIYNRAETASPSSRFGVSFSCPFIITTVEYGPPGGGEPPGPGPEPPIPVGDYETRTRMPLRLRRAPHVAQSNRFLFFGTLELVMETGVGTRTGQGADPLVMMRLSRDGGHTWSNTRTAGLGRMGEYLHRVFWNQLGRARDLVVEVRISDPVAVAILGAEIGVDEGIS